MAGSGPALGGAAVSRNPHQDLEDEALVARYRVEMRPVLLQELVRRHQKGVFVFCLRFLGDRTAAEDATQETFERMVKNLESWDGRAKFRTWLYRIARNGCIDAQRKARLRKTESLDHASDPDGGPPIERHAHPGADPEARWRGHEMKSLLLQGIGALPPAQREVLLLRQEAGLSFKEIAEMTEVSENTVKSRMRYALDHLRGLLRSQGVLP